MATLLIWPELYVAEYWQYRAEGNANLVLQYIGPNSRFRATMLRLRKVDRVPVQPSVKVNESGGQPSDSIRKVKTKKDRDLSAESLFVTNVIGLLLGQEHIERLVAVSLPGDFLKDLSAAIESSRPENRLHKGIDCSLNIGFLAPDHTRFYNVSAQYPSVAVEIKPKWGFLSKSNFLRDDQDIKRRKCRFCMYQHSKIKHGQETSLSEYCPIDLFSGEEGLVQDALSALVRTPQNNLRLFVEGMQQPITSETMEVCLNGVDISASDVAAQTGSDRDDSVSNGLSLRPSTLTDVLAQILVQSPVLKRLGRLQQALDSLDIETIHQFYVQLLDDSLAKTTTTTTTTATIAALPEPTLEEFQATAEAFMDRTDLIPLMKSSREVFERNNSDSVGFSAEDDMSEVPDGLKLHYLREFLLSATLKDCSILITVRKVQKVGDQTETSIDRIDVNPACSDFSEGIETVKVEGQVFEYKITCIDMDPKKINSIPMYLQKDRNIVEHYLSIMGDREPSCGTR